MTPHPNALSSLVPRDSPPGHTHHDMVQTVARRLEGRLSQTDLRRLRMARSSLRAVVFLRNCRERNPNLFPGAALCVANLSPQTRRTLNTKVPRSTPV